MFKKLQSVLLTLTLWLGVSAVAFGQTANGVVVDAQGQPVPGASVIVKGTTTGTMTASNGTFSIAASKGTTLEVSCIGYATVDVAAGSNLKIVLQEDQEFLEEVVVVGFGTQKKINLTGAVTAVDVEKTFAGKPLTDVAHGLQGTVPGLSIVYKNNDLAGAPTMKIRGTGSINGDNTPLILVDGVEVPDLSFVNPDNIKSISVLKDAASSSIYGSRAAWGVILITSKDGSGAKDKVTVTYSNNLSWNTPIGLPKYITTKESVLKQLDATILAQKNVDGTDIEAFGMYLKDSYDGISNWFDNGKSQVIDDTYVYGRDWEIINGSNYYWRVEDPNKETFKTAFQHSHNLNVSGNSGSTNYNIGLGYSRQESTLRYANDNFTERYNANLSINSNVTNWLNIGAKMMYTEKKFSYPYGYDSSDGAMNLLAHVMRFPTFVPMAGKSDGSKLADGTYANAKAATAEGMYFRFGNGTLIGQPTNTATDQYLTIGGNVTIQIAKGFSFHGDYTRGRYNYEQRSLRTPVYAANWNGGAGAANIGGNSMGRTFVGYTTNTVNAYFDYLLDVKDAHHMAFKLGFNAEDATRDTQSITSTGVQNVEIPTLNLTDGNKAATVSEAKKDRATAGFFGRINYNYKEKYLLELNGRYDGSSSFRPGKQWAFFGSGSVGYKISEEDFWQNIKPYVPMFKIRGSYGSVGNQALSSWYPYIPLLSTTTSSWMGTNGQYLATVTAPSVVNADMTWERIRTLDLGFDAGFLNNDLNVSFDYYIRRNIGMLVTGNEIIRYAGIASAPLENGGDLKTTGWDLEINYNHVFNKDLAVYGTFTLSDSKSVITKWNNTTGSLTGWYEGKQLGEIWGFKTDRYFTAADFNADGSLKDGIPSQTAVKSKQFNYAPGDIKYVDLDNSGAIDSGKGTINDHGDLVRIGNAIPRFEYSLRLGGVYKGFDAEILFQGVGKRDMWTYSSLFIPFDWGAQMNIFEYQLDYWTEENPNARYPRPVFHTQENMQGLPSNSGKGNFAPQTKYLNNMAYLRVKNVTVGYTLPQNLTKKVAIEKLRVYVSVQNLLTFDHINGIMDPELTGGWSSSATANIDGVDMNYAGRAMPFNRQWTCGVQVSF